MNETERKKVLEIIKQTIDEVVYDEVKKMPLKIQARQEELAKTRAQREQDAHDALFGNENEEMTYKLRLHENEEKPKITTDELINFEKEFKSRFPNISFDKQVAQGQNGQIVDFPIKNGQKDAFTSGKIKIEKNEIQFTMSLINGIKVKSIIEGGRLKEFEINSETKDVFNKLLNLYEELFKKRFNGIINSPPNQDNLGSEVAKMQPETPSLTPPTSTSIPTPAQSPSPTA
jgi:hypothetical protein